MPSPHKRKSSKRVSRSIRLRKYETTYEACLKKATVACKQKSTPVKKSRARRKPKKSEQVRLTPSKERKKSREVPKPKKKSKDRKRPLNDYQKFVREESKKDKYKGMSASGRMSEISKAWKAQKE